MRCSILIKDLKRSFLDREVLKGVDFVFPSKGMFMILGKSGCGKSTLLKIIAGLDEGYEGECQINGKEARELKDVERLNSIGFIMQDFSLLNLDDSLANAKLPLDALSAMGEGINKRRALDLLSFVGLKDKAKRTINTLSGGEKQRVCIARALSNDPDIILCDEPTGSLDSKNSHEVFSLLKKISKNKLVIVVTHDREMAKEYGDKIIEIKDGNIEEVIENYQKEKDYEKGNALPIKYKRKKSKLPLSFHLSHSFKIMKNKKWVSLISTSLISLGLLGIGLSSYISKSIKNELSDCFDSLISRKEVFVKTKNEIQINENDYSKLNKGEVEELCSLFQDYIEDYGCSYTSSFENIFSDFNDLYIESPSSSISLSSFSIRNFSEYLWLDQYPNLSIYPYRPSVMENDALILGLPYQNMYGICYSLKILRDYESLGNYISNFGLSLYVKLANYSYSYEDEQLFRIIGIAPSPIPTIYHLNHHWNEYVFEESMRFPSTLEEVPIDKPWTLEKVFYIQAKEDISKSIDAIRKSEEGESLLFERADAKYDLTHCPVEENCSLNRAYLYKGKAPIPYGKVEEIKSDKRVSGYCLCSQGGYETYSSSLLSGFNQKFFIADSLDSIDQIIDAYSSVRIEEEYLDFSLPKNALDGNYLKGSIDGFRFASDFSKLKEGNIPSSLDEIVLSSSLYKRWDRPSEIYVAGEIEEKISGERIERLFRKAKLKVSGVVEDNKNCIYANGDWTVDFLRDRLGMSSFLLQIDGMMISLKNESYRDSFIKEMNQKYPELVFSSPSVSLLESIDSTIGYIESILRVFSLISLSISAILFIVINILSINENFHEAKLFHLVGINKSDIASSFIVQSSLLILSSILICFVSMGILEFIVHGYISSTFSSSNPFKMSLYPFLWMGGFALVLLGLDFIILKMVFKKLNFNSINAL